MKSITVSKTKLLDTLQKNRDQHQAIYNEANAKFREAAVRELENRLFAARGTGKISLYINLSEPEDHTDSFDTAIAMVKWEQSDSIELTEQDFNRYVQNKWEWERSFAANTMSYIK